MENAIEALFYLQVSGVADLYNFWTHRFVFFVDDVCLLVERSDENGQDRCDRNDNHLDAY